MTRLPTYGDVDPPKGFQEMVAALRDLGQPDVWSMKWDRPARPLRRYGTVEFEFARLAKSFVYLPDPAGKDIWQPLRLAKVPSGYYVLRGDCEDAILTLIEYLLAVDIDRGAMTILTCRIHQPGHDPRGHAVLAVETSETTMICDFLLSRGEGSIQPWDAPIFRGEMRGFNRTYEWISRQKPGQEKWVSCLKSPTLADLVPAAVEKAPTETDDTFERFRKIEERLGYLEDWRLP